MQSIVTTVCLQDPLPLLPLALIFFGTSVLRQQGCIFWGWLSLWILSFRSRFYFKIEFIFPKKNIFKNLQSCQDVVAHEMGHNLTSIASQLEYTGESGCLNEAFSDLFGEMVENFATGSNDFLIAKDCMKNVSSLKINSIK